MTRHRHTPHHRGWRLCGGLRHVRRIVPLRQHGGWLSSTLPPATVHLPSSLARRQWQSAPISRWRPLHGHAARDSGRQPKRSAQYDQQPMAGKRRQWRCTPIRRWNRWCGLAAQSCRRQSWKGVAVSTSLIHPWRVIRTLTAPFAPKMSYPTLSNIRTTLSRDWRVRRPRRKPARSESPNYFIMGHVVQCTPPEVAWLPLQRGNMYLGQVNYVRDQAHAQRRCQNYL